MRSDSAMSTPLILVFFAAYVVIAVAIGVIASRKKTDDDFMIAGRQVSGFLLMATMAAGWFDGVTLSIYLAYVYQFGLPALSLFVGISAGFIMFAVLAGRIKKRADELQVYSMPEYFYRLLGKRNGMMFSAFLITQFFGYLTINFILSGKVLAHLFPSIGYVGGVVVGGAIILGYLLLAGFKAVVRTDVYQFSIMIVMTALIVVPIAPGLEIGKEDLSVARMGWGNIIGFIVIAGFGVLVAPDIWQRMIAARNPETLRRGLARTAITLPLLALVITVVGLAAKQSLRGIKPEDALVASFSNLLPLGSLEFGMVLLYAVALSSSDTVTFVVSSIITRDLRNYTKRFSYSSMVTLTRVTMVLFVIAAAFAAIFYQEIVPLALSLGSLNLALFPVVFASIFWALNRTAVLWSLIGVLTAVAALSLSGTLDPATAALSLPIGLVALLVAQGIALAAGRFRR